MLAWDDEVYTGDRLVSVDAEKVRAYSQESMNYIRQELDLPPNDSDKKVTDEPQIRVEDMRPNMAPSVEIGHKLLSGTDWAQQERLWRNGEIY